MAHPQSSPRGVIGKTALYVGSQALTANSTGVVFAGAVYASGQTGAKITGNSTGIIVPAVTVGTKAVTANSTAVIVPALRVGALASYITVNSTGIRIGSRYISTNTTGNTTT